MAALNRSQMAQQVRQAADLASMQLEAATRLQSTVSGPNPPSVADILAVIASNMAAGLGVTEALDAVSRPEISTDEPKEHKPLRKPADR